MKQTTRSVGFISASVLTITRPFASPDRLVFCFLLPIGFFFRMWRMKKRRRSGQGQHTAALLIILHGIGADFQSVAPLTAYQTQSTTAWLALAIAHGASSNNDMSFRWRGNVVVFAAVLLMFCLFVCRGRLYTYGARFVCVFYVVVCFIKPVCCLCPLTCRLNISMLCLVVNTSLRE